jgi:hypothetical protein
MVHHCPCVLFKAPGKHCCGSNKKIKMKCYEITKNLTIFTTLHSNLVVVADSIGVLCACLHPFKFKPSRYENKAICISLLFTSLMGLVSSSKHYCDGILAQFFFYMN